MKVFYHNDLDGRCAGAIVHYFYNSFDAVPEMEFIELDYKDTIPIGSIRKCEKVMIVDFSFKPEVMEAVLKITSNVIWIDHHKTAIEYVYSQNLAGIRDVGYSGCELTWMYFYGKEPMPRAVELIGDRDKWAWKFGTETAEVNQGIKLYPHQPQDKIWTTLLDSSINIAEVRAEGKICITYRDSFCNGYAESYGFETEFEGHKCFAMGLYQFGSEAFGDRMDKYDICLSFVFDGTQWTVGLYSKTIDVSEIAKKNGGGGHKGAAGFVCARLPFRTLGVKDMKIERRIKKEIKWLEGVLDWAHKHNLPSTGLQMRIVALKWVLSKE